MASIGGSELFIVQTLLHLPVLDIFRGIELVEGRLLSFEMTCCAPMLFLKSIGLHLP